MFEKQKLGVTQMDGIRNEDVQIRTIAAGEQIRSVSFEEVGTHVEDG